MAVLKERTFFDAEFVGADLEAVSFGADPKLLYHNFTSTLVTYVIFHELP